MARRRSVAARIASRGGVVMVTAVALTVAPAGAVTATKKAAKKPTVTISGDLKVKGATTLRCLQLQKPTPAATAGTRTVALLAPPAKKPLPGNGSYQLDLNVVTIGGTTTFPATSTGNPSTTPSIRFSYNTNGDYLDWGGPSVSGTVKLSADGGSGTVDLQIPFTGDDAHTVPVTAHQAVTVKGKFKCPAGS